MTETLSWHSPEYSQCGKVTQHCFKMWSSQTCQTNSQRFVLQTERVLHLINFTLMLPDPGLSTCLQVRWCSVKMPTSFLWQPKVSFPSFLCVHADKCIIITEHTPGRIFCTCGVNLIPPSVLHSCCHLLLLWWMQQQLWTSAFLLSLSHRLCCGRHGGSRPDDAGSERYDSGRTLGARSGRTVGASHSRWNRRGRKEAGHREYSPSDHDHHWPESGWSAGKVRLAFCAFHVDFFMNGCR